MTKRDDRPKDAGDLRQRAEELARERAARVTEAPTALSPEELQRTLHELRVHQIELEMQNEELRRAQAEIDAARARYFDLYDLAPAGYCTLSEEGLILEANLTLATLLGLARAALIQQPVSRFVLKEDQDIYYLHRKKLLETGEPQDCELRLVKPDGAPFWAHLKKTAARAEDGAPLCRVMISDITARKRAQRDLEASETRYRRLFESAQDGILILDADTGKIVDVNPFLMTLTGFSRDEFLDKYIWEIEPFMDVPASKALFAELHAKKYVRYEDLPMQTADRRSIDVEFVSNVYPVENQSVIQCNVRDITERRRRDVELREAKQLIDAVIENIPLMLFLKKAQDLRFVVFNRAGEELLGYDRKDLLGKNDLDLFPPEQAASFLAKDREVLAADVLLDIPEEPIQTAKKGERLLHTRKVCIKGADGVTKYLLGISEDITERKRAEQALEESRLFSESMLRTIPFPMDIVDEEGQVLFLSDKLRELVDDQTLGEHCWTRYRDNKQQCDNCSLTRDIAIGQTRVIETSGMLGGRTFEIFHKGMVFQGKRALLEIFIDVTEKKRLQIRLAQSDRLSTMGTLAAGVAHEINNPLSYVLYNIESLSQDVPKLAEVMRRCHAALCSHIGADAVNELLVAEGDSFSPAMFDDVVARFRDVLSGTIRIKDIARGLGTFSRVEGSEVAPVNMHHAAEQAINLAFNQIKYRARLVKDFGQVPFVLGSDGKLAQVFLNLLINAAHAIDEGHVEHNEIRIRTWAEGETVFAEVSDTGKGIAPEQHDRIFEPFFTTKDVGVGSGLGLSISRNIVTGFGGEISFSSEPGKGTRFLIRLPRLPRDWQTREASMQEDAPPCSTARGRILVVDDEQGIRAIIARMLGRNHEVVTAASGEEARAILEQDRRFDLIFCDLMMPRISGMELHAWLAERDADLAAQLVFMTGGAFTPGASEYLARVGNLRVEKPFDTVVFKKLTDELILAARAKLDRGS